MSANTATDTILDLARRAYGDDILRGLDAPNPEIKDNPEAGEAGYGGLFALHVGAAYHRRAVIVDVMRHYQHRSGLDAKDYPSLALVVEPDDVPISIELARTCYQSALDQAPDLAEAHFNLARIHQHDGNSDAALDCFARALDLAPHTRASPHAHMHANAHWERATLLEDLGRDKEALASYRTALANLASFGVHHQRAARFFRRMGYVAEAITEFRKGMGYSHRYFPEFFLPPLTAAEPAPAAALQPIYETGAGETIVLWNGEFYALPAETWKTVDPAATGLSEEQLKGARHGISIARLEQPA